MKTKEELLKGLKELQESLEWMWHHLRNCCCNVCLHEKARQWRIINKLRELIEMGEEAPY